MSDREQEVTDQERAILAEKEAMRLQGLFAKAKILLAEVETDAGLMLTEQLRGRITELLDAEEDWEQVFSSAAFRFHWMDRCSALIGERNDLERQIAELKVTA